MTKPTASFALYPNSYGRYEMYTGSPRGTVLCLPDATMARCLARAASLAQAGSPIFIRVNGGLRKLGTI